MASPIDGYLNQIINALYGEQVRSAIHDAIATCYDDVTASETVAIAAANAASSATDSATAAAITALSAASSATAATSSLSSIIAEASSAVIAANAAITDANTAAEAARSAQISANTAAVNANVAINSATTAATAANNAASIATTAATTATSAASAATTAASSATSAARSATAAVSSATDAITDCNAARLQAITAANGAGTATTRANAAAAAIENITVSAEGVGPDDTAGATVSTIDDHLNIHFRLKQGATGAKYIIKGDAYPSVAALEAAITSPAVGDQYNVGASAPYNVYRWTGTTWEDQGMIGISFTDLTNEEINTIWNETAVSSTTSKYINHTGLFHLIVNKIKAALATKVDAVSGKGLSTNDFTDIYKNLIDSNNDQINALIDVKVDKVTGKGLSTNDFTNEYLEKIDDHDELIGNSVLATTDQTLTGAVNEVNSKAVSLEPLRPSQKHLIVMGDSYAINTSSWTGWIEQFNSVTNYDVVASSGVGGSGIVGAPDTQTVLQQLNSMTIANPDIITDIVILGGYNDASAIVYYDKTETDFESAIISLANHIKQRFKNAKTHYGFIAVNEENTGFQSSLNSTATMLKRLCTLVDFAFIPNAQYVLLNHDYILQGSDSNAKSHPNSSGTLAIARFLNAYLSSKYSDVIYGFYYGGINFYSKNGELTAFPDTYSFSSILPAMTYPFNTWTTIADLSGTSTNLLWGTHDAATCYKFWASVYTNAGTFLTHALFRIYDKKIQINPLNSPSGMTLAGTSWICLEGFTAPFESMYG